MFVYKEEKKKVCVCFFFPFDIQPHKLRGEIDSLSKLDADVIERSGAFSKESGNIYEIFSCKKYVVGVSGVPS